MTEPKKRPEFIAIEEAGKCLTAIYGIIWRFQPDLPDWAERRVERLYAAYCNWRKASPR